MMLLKFLTTLLILIFSMLTFAQEQSRESAAVDPTASQWSLQFAYEGKFDYKEQKPAGREIMDFFNFDLSHHFLQTKIFQLLYCRD